LFVNLAPRFAFAVTLLAAVLTASCADTRGGSIPYDRSLAAPDEPKIQTLPENYKIAPLDMLSIKVFNSQDISGDYAVDLAGHISLPLVGEIEAVNLTTGELDQKLTELLGKKYFEHPDVSVAIKQSTAHVVTVDLTAIRRGEAADPQIYPGDIVVVDGSKIKEFQKQFFQSIPLLSVFRPF